MAEPGASFMLDAATAEELTGGRWIGSRGELVLHGLAIDSRQVMPGCIFACFTGQHVDGHDYADTAVGDGAALILAAREVEVPVPVLVVADVTAALGALAAAFRDHYSDAVWIAITGSNGKTTVKELAAAACGASDRVWCTPGNRNNAIGVPLTVLNTPAGVRYVIVELGASAPGEIDTLARIVRPDVGVITNIGPAHLAGMGGLEGVTRTKCELFGRVAPHGRVLFCRHGLDAVCAEYDQRADDLLAIVRAAAGSRQLTIVGDPGCPIAGEAREAGLVLRTVVGEVSLQLMGTHNLANASLAWHLAVAAGADAQRALGGLAAVGPSNGRLQQCHLGEHLLLDDSYNANPGSMEAGLRVLSQRPGARLAVLGAMAELGQESAQLHRRVGAEAARLGLPLLTVGRTAAAIGTGYTAAGGRDHCHVRDADEAVAVLRERLRVGPTSVLVKASRSAGLDRIPAALMEALGHGSARGEGDGGC